MEPFATHTVSYARTDDARETFIVACDDTVVGTLVATANRWPWIHSPMWKAVTNDGRTLMTASTRSMGARHLIEDAGLFTGWEDDDEPVG